MKEPYNKPQIAIKEMISECGFAATTNPIMQNGGEDDEFDTINY